VAEGGYLKTGVDLGKGALNSFYFSI